MNLHGMVQPCLAGTWPPVLLEGWKCDMAT
jgi:hypothetical protein